MAKIIKIIQDEVVIAMDNQELITVYKSSLDFNPKVQDIVEVYHYKGEYIVNLSVQPSRGSSHTNNTYTTINQNVVGGRMVNKLVYILLAFLVGGVGGQFFYAHNYGAGIFCVLFCWTGIPAIIGLVQGIMAIAKEEVQPGMIIV